MANNDNSFLDRKVRDYCNKVRKNVKKSYLDNPNKKKYIHDYPACVVACENNHMYDSCEVNESKIARPVFYTNHLLRDALQKLAPIGGDSNLCKNKVGSCAEPHAAELVLRKNNTGRLNHLNFSDAIRQGREK